MPAVEHGSAFAKYVTDLLDSSLTWDDVDWLKSLSPLPLVIKGIMTAEDAVLAVDHGTAGIVVSNHGGRQLDSTLGSLDALPDVVAAVRGRIEVSPPGNKKEKKEPDLFLFALGLGGEPAGGEFLGDELFKGANIVGPKAEGGGFSFALGVPFRRNRNHWPPARELFFPRPFPRRC